MLAVTTRAAVTPFRSFWMGGFECTDKLNAFGNRVDVLNVTRHLELLAEDYRSLALFNIRTVREGIRWSQVENKPYTYDRTTVERMMDFANMSKAFTRETDDDPEPTKKPSRSVLPPGARNYITARGIKSLRREVLELSAQPPSSQIRQRLLALQNSLLSAEVVEPPPAPWTQVQFGATVSIRNQQGEEIDYAIVGVDETDWERNHISWLSPIAKALIKRRVGEHVRFRTPAGEQNWEIIKVVHEDGTF